MKKIINASALIFLIGLVTISYSQEKTYTETSTEIVASVGENFTISLESNQSTGYSWSVGMVSDNAQVVVAGMDYDLPEGSKTGQGGAEVWHLKAVAPGSVKLMFYYSRSWEKDAPAKTVTFNVSIK
ncbi:MAG: protease inhibitor I42 family protein [Ignavibacteria bacterium]|mgnify:CR=1 FL=1|nr:protease inhibitor I42 family protein [Ignavibacteria bacterium]